MPTPRAYHARAERTDRQLVRQVIRIHHGVVVAVDRLAINKEVATAVRTHVTERYRLLFGHLPQSISENRVLYGTSTEHL